MTLNSGRVIAFSLLLWACSATDSNPSQGSRSDELSTSDDAASADSSALVLDVLPSDTDVDEPADAGVEIDATSTVDVALAPDGLSADAQEVGDDGCPAWIPLDEPDFGKPPQPPSSMAVCTAELPCADGEKCTLDYAEVENVTQGVC